MGDLAKKLLKAFEAFDERLNSADESSYRYQEVDERHLVISAATYIEAVIGEAASSLFTLLNHGVSDLEVLAVNGQTLSVKKSGDVEFRDLKLDTQTRFKATAKLFSKIDPSYTAIFEDEGWHAVLRTTEVRNRLVHPKRIEDLDVQMDELTDAHLAVVWVLKQNLDWLHVRIKVLDRQSSPLNALAALGRSSDQED